MVFCSSFFLFLFLPVCLLLYYTTPNKYRNYSLLLFSFIFYFWGETSFAWLILCSIFFNYGIGILISESNYKKILITVGVIGNLLALMYYKYFVFFTNLINPNVQPILKIALPLGISFYTFHSISYLVDIYREKVKPQYNLVNMGLYIVNFMQLVAGPIIRYHDVERQLTKRIHSFSKISFGIKLFIKGLTKKMIIANTAAAFADQIFNSPINSYTTIYAWLGVLAYTIQIYFDFSGYSDMAIGLAKMFGFDFKINFNIPYSATSIRDFWQRWHISLSTWFRDYLYIPLGGNRNGTIRTGFNLLLVFLLCGFWHGANVTFIAWGCLHGFFLVIERLASNSIKRVVPQVIKHAYVWLVVMMGWVLFRSNSLTSALNLFKKLFFIDKNCLNTYPDTTVFINPFFNVIIIFAIIISVLNWKELSTKLIYNKYLSLTSYRLMEIIVLTIFFMWSIGEMLSNSYNPFIYYNF